METLLEPIFVGSEAEQTPDEKPVISKEWTVEQVRELTVLAKRKGYNKGALATALLGVHPSTISEWLKPDRAELPMMTRHAIERVEMWLKTRHDVLSKPSANTEEPS